MRGNSNKACEKASEEKKGEVNVWKHNNLPKKLHTLDIFARKKSVYMFIFLSILLLFYVYGY